MTRDERNMSILSPTHAVPAAGLAGTARRAGLLHDRRLLAVLVAAPTALLLAYADGFWMTSLQGAIGAIERAQTPFATWWRSSTLILPVYLLAVLGALALARRWFGPSLRGWRPVVVTTLLIAAFGTLVGIGDLVANAAYDYHLQSSLIQLQEATHTTGTSAAAAAAAHLTGSGMAGMEMGSVSSQLHTTLVVHARGASMASGLMLATNLVLVGWLVALRGGHWGSRRQAQPVDAARPADR
jgi:hypothetical protein